MQPGNDCGKEKMNADYTGGSCMKVIGNQMSDFKRGP